MTNKILILLLSAILLSASCVALADEADSRTIFTFSAEFDDSWNSINAINGFLAQYPLSLLDVDESELESQMYRIVRFTSAGSEDRACVKGITLTGKKYASAETLYIFQFLPLVIPVKGDLTLETAEAEFFGQHSDAEAHIHLQGQYGDAIVCLILYSEPYMEP